MVYLVGLCVMISSPGSLCVCMHAASRSLFSHVGRPRRARFPVPKKRDCMGVRLMQGRAYRIPMPEKKRETGDEVATCCVCKIATDLESYNIVMIVLVILYYGHLPHANCSYKTLN